MRRFRKRKYWRSITPLLWLEYFAHRTLPHLFESHMAYIPFSAANESRLVRRKLSKALSVWASLGFVPFLPDVSFSAYLADRN